MKLVAINLDEAARGRACNDLYMFIIDTCHGPEWLRWIVTPYERWSIVESSAGLSRP
jgi:uncharacterized protein YqcC (DUF446 family)